MAAFALRYARAFADVAAEKKFKPADLEKQFASLLETWKGSAELREVFENPAVAAAQKIAVLDKLSNPLGLSAEVRNFVAVLIEHGRIHALEEVVAAFEAEMKARAGIRHAEVTTTRTLSPQEREGLIKGMEKLAGSKVEASFREDKAILGGAVVRIGSTVYDGSVRGRMERLREALVR